MIIDPTAFDDPPDFDWLERAEEEGTMPGGRAAARRLVVNDGTAIHRHYRRGGHVAILLGDRYWFTGYARTRAAIEFRLLADLRAQGLRVPRPLLARVRRSGLHYRADLLTQEIADARSIATLLATTPDQVPWAAMAASIADLHFAGVFHADLNAHNLLLDAEGHVWVIDLDRADLRLPKLIWRELNLERLHRSFVKLGAPSLIRGFDATWQSFLDDYAGAFARRKRGPLS